MKSLHICDRIGTCIGSLAGSGCYLLGDNDRYLFYHTRLILALKLFHP